MIAASLRRMITHPAAGGVLLFAAALAAIVMANTDARALYNAIIYFPAQSASATPSHLSLLVLVNDGLMAVFFLAVGLEVKYELLQGALNSRVRAAFPAIAALGGMVAPAVIYSLMTAGTPALRAGWAIPAATDIAFAVGVLALLGTRVPVSLKVFMLALAIIDDLGAIVIIALFYNTALEPLALAAAGAVIGIMALMNRANVRFLSLYLLLGAVLWGCILLSGIHATLAGVVVGGLIPLTLPSTEVSPARALEHWLQPWVVYLILPLFAFANAGISLQGVAPGHLISFLPLGIAAGLVVGKPLGIVLFTAVAVKLRLARLPAGIAFRHIAAAAMLCGIGFTMSIFIANLAFGHDDPETIVLAKVGILSGSVIAALLGYLLLRAILPQPQGSGSVPVGG
ncbi:Na()/H() antiporter NhaA [Sodalis glossinidius str. 'morsitans']|uniref:Na(+)/H(+) antiporter NhaA n=2 Tax=Sodalis glossinidius (strain morsitans) TaxID=343509 RepID=NHAA_SODGM|nr:RecName: Full=Na(+)/H(+) antiporter NhaA; AltName: Full=Sodium/proton antiporter NhaA [Sodalis glossinidius str. 'morsitans']BAE73686.1 sodium-hydrogen antiporter [Sodalis glossinidius str. 'morsitans']CRL44094.1 Na()/H() antiporter NhaA [Sodalis glossinidius str. 'morsitans']